MEAFKMANRRIVLWKTEFGKILKICCLVTVLWDVVTITSIIPDGELIYLIVNYVFKLVMSAVNRKLADLKDKLLAKINEKFREFKCVTTEINDQIKNEVNEAIGAKIRKQDELESTVAILQQHVKNFKSRWWCCMIQYGKRLCIRGEGVPATDNETIKIGRSFKESSLTDKWISRIRYSRQSHW